MQLYIVRKVGGYIERKTLKGVDRKIDLFSIFVDFFPLKIKICVMVITIENVFSVD